MKEKVRAFYTLRWYALGISVFIGLLWWTTILIEKSRSNTARRELVTDMTYQKTFRLTGLGVQERYNVYLDFCIRVWNVHGNTYHKPSKLYPVPEAMDMDTRSKIWRENFELAEMMGFTENGRGYYTVFIKGILESALNPNEVGPYGEKTFLQLKPIAVLQAKGVYECMIPNSWKKALYFEWNGDMDTLTSIDALRIAYLLAWYYKRCYKEQKVWYVSLYHWGHGFLGVHFRDGYGVIPKHFVINDIQYDPLGYYISHQTMEDAFANGDIEAGKEVATHWHNKRKQILKEERTYIEVKKAYEKIASKVDKLERTLDEKDRIIEQGRSEIKDLRTTIKEADVKFRKTFLGAKHWKGGDIRAFIWNNAKDIAKSLTKHADYRKENRTLLIVLSITVAVGLAILTFLIVSTVKYWRGRKRLS